MSPVEKVAYAILLSADKKRASELWLRREGVAFELDGAWHEELSLPPALYESVMRLLAVMASLPAYGEDEYAQGTIVLAIGEERQLAFEIRMRGHGESLEARLRPREAP